MATMLDTASATALRTARLILRPPAAADVPALVAGAGDLEVSRWLARVPHPYTSADARAFLAEVDANGGAAFAIARPEDPGALIGIIGIDAEEAGGFGLGYWLARPFWGRGYMGEAARAVVDHGFGRMGIDALTSGLFEGNAASLAIQRRLGFAVMGRRPVYCAALGRSRTHIDTALPRCVWEATA